MRWTFLLFAICSACHSKPVATSENPSGSVVFSKVTQTGDDSRMTLFFVKVAYGPRRVEELVSAFSLNSANQACFRSKSGPVVADVSGKVNYSGGIEALTVRSADKDLASCLTKSFDSLNVGRGRIGPFKARLTTDPQAAEGSKGLILGTPSLKKFE